MNRSKAKEVFVKFYCKNEAFCELYPDRCKKEGCEIYHAIKAIESNRDELDRAYAKGWDNGEAAERSRHKDESTMHGEWEEGDCEIVGDDIMGGETIFQHYVCSECGFDIGGHKEYRYCPSCGSRNEV